MAISRLYKFVCHYKEWVFKDLGLQQSAEIQEFWSTVRYDFQRNTSFSTP